MKSVSAIFCAPRFFVALAYCSANNVAIACAPFLQQCFHSTNSRQNKKQDENNPGRENNWSESWHIGMESECSKLAITFTP